MGVIPAMTPPVGARPATPFRDSGSIRDRFAAFLHHPAAVVRRNLDELPFDYPPLVVISADVALFVVGVAALIQRHSYFPTVLPVLALMAVFVCVPLFFVFGIVPRPALLGASAVGATALFLMQPVPADFAPFVLVVVVGEIAAIVSKRASATFAVIAIVELAFDTTGKLWLGVSGDQRFEDLPMYAFGVVLGWLCGVLLQYQRRFLYREHEYREIRTTQAADEERRRIAREVHDVVAHSLSITLLHLTAARHALQTDRDVDEAVDALVDAERLGRQAMADIRRTVGLLEAGPSKPDPEPGVHDISDLVGDFVRAGLDVRYECADDLDAVSAAVGLALYRIGQESLANVVKHAPGGSATVRLTVDPALATLAVHNTVPAGLPPHPGRGMGLSGMQQRTELLGGRITAGPYDDGWSMRAEIPLAPGQFAAACSVLNAVGATKREQA